MKKKNLLFPVIFSLVVLVALVAPLFNVNGDTSSWAQIVFGTSKRLTCIVGLIGADLVALAVLTYFEQLTNVKFFVALGGLIYFSFIFMICHICF